MNSWREAITLPILAEEREDWSLDHLKMIIQAAAWDGARACIDEQAFVAICLSGGLDSTLILGLIREIIPCTWIKAYTVGGARTNADVVYAHRVAAHYGIHHHVFIPTPTQHEDAMQVVSKYEAPTQGNIGVFLLYQFLKKQNVRAILAGDGIDELMGGYWEHRAPRTLEEKLNVFDRLWKALEPEHLLPLAWKAAHEDVQVHFPYLQIPVVKAVAQIPLDDRTSREESKKPLREIARRLKIPDFVIDRKKQGFCDALLTA